MNRLDQYLFRQGAIPFLMILLCSTAVIWLTQVLQRVDLMVEDGGSLWSFTKVTVLLIPSLVGVIIPFAMLGAVLYAINVLATDNELPVISAAGASRFRTARPILLLSVMASLVVLLINVDLQPRSYRVMKETVESVRSDVARTLIRSKIFSEVSDGITVYAEEVRPGDQYIGLLIHDSRDSAKPITYTAERGMFKLVNGQPRLLMVRGTIQQIDPDTGRAEILRFIETAIDMATFSKSENRSRNLESTERYLSELFAPDLTNPYAASRADSFRAEGHSRLATPLYPMAFAALALAIMLTAPVSRQGYSRRLMMAIGAAILLRTVGYVLQNAGSGGPVFNTLQYVLPAAAILVSLAVIAGKFWIVKRRPAPDIGRILDNPNGLEAASS
ncbi:LptF/LptG family permease [Parvularcula sp. LCG005]|uniref:LptF/LptG family permease n=1 Tax=Parvularcula sp. LCG005 TaxID=3078805 RepID=UPI002942BA8C|nr:LptF/LptG family permease [Parvularcula sp. LCG005]WOI52292.1 LptF/LptG family permease [Parvularcula sp. LCG005]